MRIYYLFIVREEYHKLYSKNPRGLYDILYNLYQLKKPNLSYGFSLFDSICRPFAVKLLNHYIQNRYTCTTYHKIIHVHSLLEKTFIQIGYGSVIIKSNVNIPDILRVFYIYNKNIFVCDFKNNDYFWLNAQMEKKKVNFS